MFNLLTNKYFVMIFSCVAILCSVFFAGYKTGKTKEQNKIAQKNYEEQNKLLAVIKKNIAENAALNEKSILDLQKYKADTTNLTKKLNDEIKKNSSNYSCRVSADILQLRAKSRDRANLLAASSTSNAAMPTTTSSER